MATKEEGLKRGKGLTPTEQGLLNQMDKKGVQDKKPKNTGKKIATVAAAALLAAATLTVPAVIYYTQNQGFRITIETVAEDLQIQQQTIKLKKGSTIGDIKAPNRPGYFFAGFYADANLSHELALDAELTKETTIYLYYILINYNFNIQSPFAEHLTFTDLNGNELDTTKPLHHGDRFIVVESPLPGWHEVTLTIEGANYVGQTTDGHNIYEIVADNKTADDKFINVIYEEQINSYHIVFFDENGDMLAGYEEYANRAITHGDKASVPNPSKDSTVELQYTFKHWLLVDEQNKPILNENGEEQHFNFEEQDIIGNICVRAVFDEGEPREYALNIPEEDLIHLQLTLSKTEADITTEKTVRYGDVINIKLHPTEGHHCTKLDINGQSYLGQDSFEVAGDVTIDYEEEINEYTVEFYDENLKEGQPKKLGEIKVKWNEFAEYAHPSKKSDSTYNYAFDKWVLESGEDATENLKNVKLAQNGDILKVYASYTNTYIEYHLTIPQHVTVTYLKGTSGYKANTKLTQANTLHYGDLVKIEYEVDEGHHAGVHTVDGMVFNSGDEHTITGDTIIKYSEDINLYTVNFLDYNGDVIQSVQVEHGGTASFTGKTPTRESDNTFTYTHNGWDTPLTGITDDVDINPTFKAEYIEYKVNIPAHVTLEYLSGTSHLDNEEYGHAQHVTLNGQYTSTSITLHYGDRVNLTCQPTVGHSVKKLTVNGGDVNGEGYAFNIESTVNIEYEEKINSYTVTFKNYDDKVFDTVDVTHGATAEPSRKDKPTKPSNEMYYYTFKGWSTDKASDTVADLTNITGPATFYAIYEQHFVEYDLTIADHVTVTYVSGTSGFEKDQPLTQGNKLHYGDKIKIEYKASEGHHMTEFKVTGADGDAGEYSVSGHVTITYQEAIDTHTVTFYNYDGTEELGEITVNWGEDASYTNADPTRKEDNIYTYTFSGSWASSANGEVAASLKQIKEDAAFYAIMRATYREYTLIIPEHVTVTYISGTSNIEQEETLTHSAHSSHNYKTLTSADDHITLHYGDKIQISCTPTEGWHVKDLKVNEGIISPDSQYDILGATTITYSEEINTYSVTFYTHDGQVLTSIEVKHGDAAEYPSEPPTREQDNVYTYSFKGWGRQLDGDDVSDMDNITGKTSFYAKYNATYREYELTIQEQYNYNIKVTYVSGSSDKYHNGDEIESGATLHYGDRIKIEYKETEGHTGSYTIAGNKQESGAEYEIIGDTQIVYTENINMYTVRFLNEKGGVIQTKSVEYGSKAIFDGEEPTKDSDTTFNYKFSGWKEDLENITKATDFHPTFKSTYIEYTVTIPQGAKVEYVSGTSHLSETEHDHTKHIDENGVYSSNINLHYGDKVKIYYQASAGHHLKTLKVNDQPFTPNNEYTVQGTVNIVYEEEIDTYTVNFYNYNGGDALYTTSVQYKHGVQFDGDTPTHPEDNTYKYKFIGWGANENATETVDLSSITGDTNFYAVYSEEYKEYKVSINDAEHVTIEIISSTTTDDTTKGDYPTEHHQHNQEGVTDGDTLHYGDRIKIEYHESEGKDKSVFNVNSVEFVSGSEHVVTGDVSIVYIEVVTEYTVTFYDYKGDEIVGSNLIVEHNNPAEYKGETPTKPSNEKFDYTFTNWGSGVGTNDTVDLSHITKNTEVYAQFAETWHEYDLVIPNHVTAKYLSGTSHKGAEDHNHEAHTTENGTYTDETIHLHYGDRVQLSTQPSEGYRVSVLTVNEVDASSDGAYTFSIEKDTTIRYAEEKKTYTVTFYNYDNEVYDIVNVQHGDTAQLKKPDPTRPQDEIHYYTFKGWGTSLGAKDTVELTNITESTSFYAVYEEHYREYKLTISETKASNVKVTYQTGTSTHVQNDKLETGANLHYGDTIKIEYTVTTGYHLTTFTVNEGEFGNGNTHEVKGAVNILYSESVNEYTLSFPENVRVYKGESSQGTPVTSEQENNVAYTDTLYVEFTTPIGHKNGKITAKGLKLKSGDESTSGSTYTITETENGGEISFGYEDEIKQFTLGEIPANVTVMKGKEKLTQGSLVQYDDELTITFTTPEGHENGQLEVSGLTHQGGDTYKVTETEETKPITIKYKDDYISYTLNIRITNEQSGTVTVKRNGEELHNGDPIHIDDVLTLEYTIATGYHLNTFTANAQDKEFGGTITVGADDVEIILDAALNSFSLGVLPEGVKVYRGTAANGNALQSGSSVTYGEKLYITTDAPALGYHVSTDLTVDNNYFKLESEHVYTVDGTSVQALEDQSVIPNNAITYATEINTYTLTYDNTKILAHKESASGDIVASGSTVKYNDILYITWEVPEGKQSAQVTAIGLDLEDGSASISGCSFKVTATENNSGISLNYSDEYIEYSLSIPDQVKVTYVEGTSEGYKGGRVLTKADKLHFGDKIKIEYTETEGKHETAFSVSGANPEGENYSVTDNVEITYQEEWNTFIVEFYKEDKESLIQRLENVIYNTEASITNPTKDSDNTFNYTFKEWKLFDGDGSATDLLKNVKLEQNGATLKVYASYTSEYIEYTINGIPEYIQVNYISGSCDDKYAQNKEISNGNSVHYDDVIQIKYLYSEDIESITVNGTEYKDIKEQAITYTVKEKITSIDVVETTYLIFEHISGGYKVTGFKPSRDEANLVIPDTYHNENVIEIAANAFQENETITSVKFGKNLTNVGTQAFKGCTNIASVEFSKDIIKLVNNLEDVMFPDSVIKNINFVGTMEEWCEGVELTTQMDSPQENMTHTSFALAFIKADDANYQYTLSINGDVITHANIPEGVKLICAYAFACTDITEVTIPASVTTIESFSFVYTNELTKINYNAINANAGITVDDTKDFVLEDAFPYVTFMHAGYNTDGIELVIGEGVTAIPAYIFGGGVNPASLEEATKDTPNPEGWKSVFEIYLAPKITSISFPSTLTDVAAFAFTNIYNLEKVGVTNGIGNTNFNIKAFDSAQLGTSLELIFDGTMQEYLKGTPLPPELAETASSQDNMSSLYLIYMRLFSTENLYFDNTSGMRFVVDGKTLQGEIDIPNGVTYICSGAFLATPITAVNIPTSVTNIGEGAFVECSILTEIIIPENVTTIGEGAFDGCTSLTKVTINSAAIYKAAIGTESTAAGDLLGNATTITVPKSIVDNKENVNNYLNNMANFMRSESGANYVFTAAEQTVLKYSWASDGVTLKVDGFRDGKSAAALEIPDEYMGVAVTEIGDNAFENNKTITNITIGANVKVIEESAFSGVTNLTSVDFAKAKSLIIGANAFNGCASLTKLTITEGITSIGESAFTDLTEIEFGSYVKNAKVMDDAFNGSLISTVKFTGTMEEWCKGVQVEEDYMLLGAIPYSGTVSYLLYLNNNLDCLNPFSIEYYINGQQLQDELVLPETITDISAGAFLLGRGITSTTIPSTVKTISPGAFAIRQLQTVDFSQAHNLQSIGMLAFAISGLGEVDLSKCLQLTTIDVEAFAQCDNLTKVNLQGATNLSTISNEAFKECGSLTTLLMPDEVQAEQISIGEHAFAGCSELKELGFGKDLLKVNIDPTAFEDSSKFTTLRFYGTIDEWAEGIDLSSLAGAKYKQCGYIVLFYEAHLIKLTDILNHNMQCYTKEGLIEGDISINSAKNISACAFAEIQSLTAITIGASVQNINERAFLNCENLTDVTILSADVYAAAIDTEAAGGLLANATTITVPQDIVTANSNTYLNSGLFKRTENGKNYVYQAASTLPYSLGTIPDGVTVVYKSGHSSFGTDTTLSSNATLHYGDQISITYQLTDGYHLAANGFSVSGATAGSGNIYTVTDNISITFKQEVSQFKLSSIPGNVTVTFVKAGSLASTLSPNAKLNTTSVLHKGDQIKFEYARPGYTFESFTINGGNPIKTNQYIYTVTGDNNASISVSVKANINQYTVTFYSTDNSTSLQTSKVNHGSKPSFTGNNPTKASDGKYNYTFEGWSTQKDQETGILNADLPEVTGAVNYYPAFSKTYIDYNLSILVKNANSGSITVKRNGSVIDGNTKVHKDDVLTLTYSISTGYHLNSFTVNTASKTSGSTFTVGAGDVSVVLDASLNTFKLGTLPAGVRVYLGTSASGTEVKTGGNVTYGDTIFITTDSVAAGYHVSTPLNVDSSYFKTTTTNKVYTVNGASIQALENAGTIANTAIQYATAEDTYTLNIPKGVIVKKTSSNGAVVSDGAKEATTTIKYNEVYYITYKETTGYHKSTFTVPEANFTAGSNSTYTVKDVADKASISITFTEEANTYKLTIPAGVTVKKGSKDGSTVTNGGNITYGETLYITAAASAGHHITTALSVSTNYFTSTGASGSNLYKVDGPSAGTLAHNGSITNGLTFATAANTYKLTVPTGVTVKKGSSSGDSIANGGTVTYGETYYIEVESLPVGYHITTAFSVSSSFFKTKDANAKTYTLNGTTAGTTSNNGTLSNAISYAREVNTYTMTIPGNVTVKRGSSTGTEITGTVTVKYNEILYVVGKAPATGSHVSTALKMSGDFTSAGTNLYKVTKTTADGDALTNPITYATAADTYTLNIPKGVEVRKTNSGGEQISDGTTTTTATIKYNEVYYITYHASIGHHMATFDVPKANFTAGSNSTYTVKDAADKANISITFTEAINSYTLKIPAGVTVKKDSSSGTVISNGANATTATIKYNEKYYIKQSVTTGYHQTAFSVPTTHFTAGTSDVYTVKDATDGSTVSITFTQAITELKFSSLPENTQVTIVKLGSLTTNLSVGATVTTNTVLHYGDQVQFKYSRTGYTFKSFKIGSSTYNDNPYTYTFNGTANTTLAASVTDEINHYSVKFYNWNGSKLLQTITVDHGKTAAFSGTEQPTREQDATYSYTFSGNWSATAEGSTTASLTNVTGAKNFYAIMTATARVYKISSIPSGVAVTFVKAATGLTSTLKANNSVTINSELHYGDQIKIKYTLTTGYSLGTFNVTGATHTGNLANDQTHTVTGNVGITFTQTANEYTISNIPADVTITFVKAGSITNSLKAGATLTTSSVLHYGDQIKIDYKWSEAVDSFKINNTEYYNKTGWNATEQSVTYTVSGNITSITYNESTMLNFEAVSDGFKVTGYKNGKFSANLVIPDTYHNQKVTEVGSNAFEAMDGTFGNEDISSITLGKNIKRIGDYAFCANYSTSLTSINLPDGLVSIGAYAFAGWSCLEELTIPSTVTTIGTNAFEGANNVTNLYYNANATMGNNAFMSCGVDTDGITIQIGDNVTSIPANFISDTNIKKVIIGKSVTKIGDGAFGGDGYATPKEVVVNSAAVYKLLTSAQSCGNLIIGATSITVPKTIVDSNDNTYLENISNFLQVASGSNYQFKKLEATDLIYTLLSETNTWRVDGLKSGKKVSNLIIPDTYMGYNVARLKESAFENNTDIKSVTIGRNVEDIPYKAFYNCKNITTINFNAIDATRRDSIVQYAYSPFYGVASSSDVQVFSAGCKVVFGDEVVNIPDYLFAGWDGGSMPYTVNITSVTIGKNVKTIGSHAFYYCTPLKSVLFQGNKVTSIGEAAFMNCLFLPSITIPENVTSIGLRAFYNCQALEQINFNAANCADIPDSNFVFDYVGQGTDNGAEVVFGNTVKRIPANLFADLSYVQERAPHLSRVTIGTNVTSIGADAFWDTSLKEVVFANSGHLTEIGHGAFAKNQLQRVNIPEGVTKLGYTSFHYCLQLEAVSLPSTLKTIEYRAFIACSALTSVNLSTCHNLLEIGESAFNSCTALTEITIPESVTTIGDHAFHYTTHLSKVNFNAINVTESGSYIFSYAGDAYESYSVVFGDNVQIIPADLFKADDTEPQQYIESVRIGANVTSIGHNAFQGCGRLMSLDMGDARSLTDIGNWAFYDCYLLTTGQGGELEIPSTVERIGSHAFQYCKNLQSVVIYSDTLTIEEAAFYGCTNLKSIDLSYANHFKQLGDDVFGEVVADIWVPSNFPYDSNDERFGRCSVHRT